ncbi:DUF4258 domain-containing protein [Cohnella sp. AR92]|uniref:DUF4258 domain-containing protein n=1 Tax=Cohnella sp. AR92 TaxID=648716 RepID=UPI000F8D765A|nr:DUF4258 domain-containing protein [Cohnella sp. AR92]RUS44933.1 DUF4258 domain-containing protein [Cohnella sp. AR92]
MKCENEELCRSISEEKFARMEPHLAAAARRLERFRQAYENGEADLAFDEHASFREVWRAFSETHILEALMNGEIIECRKRDGEYGFLIWYNVKIGRGQYRPMHVPVVMPVANPNYLVVVTVYDPRSKEWQWTDNYTRRICRCN